MSCRVSDSPKTHLTALLSQKSKDSTPLSNKLWEVSKASHLCIVEARKKRDRKKFKTRKTDKSKPIEKPNPEENQRIQNRKRKF
jgi:hypothetical protein